MNIVEGIYRRALLQPQAPALITPSRTLPYRGLVARVGQLAALLAEEGVARGDVVGLDAHGLMPHITLTLAIAHLGAVSLPLSLAGDKEPVDDIVDDCEMKFIVHTRGTLPRMDRKHACKVLEFESFADRKPLGPAPEMVATDPGDLWRISLSSGTTGRPKAIQFTHENALLKVHLMRGVFPASPADCMMLGTGVGLSFSINYTLRTLHYGGAVARPSQPSPRAMLEMLHKGTGTFLVTTPAYAAGMVDLASKPDSPFAARPPQLKTLALSGSAVSPRLLQLARKHLCTTIWNNYGATEVGVIAMADAEMMRNDPRCAGRLMPWVEAHAVDESGERLPPGEMGLLRVRSAMNSSGYRGAAANPAPDAKHGFFRDGWYHSSDIGAVNADGMVVLGGRDNDLINLSGVKIDPVRVEQAIQADAAVLECAVIALPGPTGIPVLTAAIVAPGQVDLAALQKRCAELGRHMVPRAVVKVPKLPRNDSGKVMRDELGKMMGAAAARRRAQVAAAKGE